MLDKHKNDVHYINGLIALLFVFMLILVYLSSQKKMNEIDAEVHTTRIELDHYLQTGANSVEYLATTAQELAKKKQLLDVSLAKTIHPINNSGEFALDNPSYPNLTGHGGLNHDLDALCDMQMSLELTEYFKVASKMNKNFAWIYYISTYKYLTMYPYIDSNQYVWHYENSLKDTWQLALPKNNSKRSLFFTPIYVDGAGKGLMITIGKPVYVDDTFKGTLNIDFTVDTLSQFLDRHNTNHGTYVLINKNNDIVAASGLEGFNTQHIFSTKKLLPKVLSQTNYDKSFDLDISSYSVKSNKLHIAPFRLYYYKDNWSIYAQSFVYIIFILLLIVLLFGLRKLMLDLDKSNKELSVLATTDVSTNLYNKRYFENMLNDLFQKECREDVTIGLMMIDIDNFKEINDNYGHPVGDKVIVHVANLLKDSLRKDDIVSRYGGDEYIIVLPNMTAEVLKNIAQKVRKKIYTTPFCLDDISHTVTVSIGIALIDKNTDENIEQSIQRVDTALYNAKISGKNNVTMSDKMKKEENAKEQ